MNHTGNITKKPCLPADDGVCILTQWIYYIVPPSLLLLGTLGNIMNIILLSRKNLRNKPVFLLAFLAVFDMFLLWATVPSRMSVHIWRVSPYEVSMPICKFSTWLSIFGASASLWTVSVVTIERCIVVIRGAGSSVLPSRNKNVCLLMAVVMVMLIISVYVVFLDEVYTSKICPYRPDIKTEIATTIAFLWLLIFPGFVVLLGNAILFCLIRRHNSSRDRNNNDGSQNVISLMLALLMLVTYPPYTTMVTLQGLNLLPADQPWVHLLEAATLCLFCCNYTFNFACYWWGGALFKKEIKLMMSELRSWLER